VDAKDVLVAQLCHQVESMPDDEEHSDRAVGEQDDCLHRAYPLHRDHPCDQI
jgi:hypothetical protein